MDVPLPVAAVAALAAAAAAAALALWYAAKTEAAGDRARPGWCDRHREAVRGRADAPPPCGAAFDRAARAVMACVLPAGYDPAGEAAPLGTLERFVTVRNGTSCVFARRSRIWGAPDWDGALGLEGNVVRAAPALALFCAALSVTRPQLSNEAVGRMLRGERLPRSRWGAGGVDEERQAKSPPLDGFLVEVRGAEFGATVPAFARTVRRVLEALSRRDPGGRHTSSRAGACGAEHCSVGAYYGTAGVPGAGSAAVGAAMDAPPEAFDSPRWHFHFAGEPFFVTSFAPCYPASHPRHMFPRKGLNETSCFVLLQPEQAFLQRNISPDSAETNWDAPRTERDRIRVAFRDAGRPYVVPESVHFPTAHYIVPAVPVDGPIVRWWEA